jgi:hypothetical protein
MIPVIGNDPATCTGCEEQRTLISFVVSAAGGSDSTNALCVECLRDGHPLMALIEPPDLSPGRKPPSRRIRKRTDKEEQELADLSDGKRQKGSGSLPYLKGDFHRKGVYRGESKTCFGKDPSWTLDELTKIRGEAAYGEVPVLVTTFMDKHTHAVKERWATIPFENWQEKYAPRDPE